MKRKFQPWHLAAFAIVVCAGVAWLVHSRSGLNDAARLVEFLPPDRSTHVYIDVDALRRSGLLDLVAGSKASESPDYRSFVEQTRFNYRTDMDAVAAAFLNGNEYFAVRGRFDWKRLA